MKSGLPTPSKGVPAEENIGLQVIDDQLTVYAYSKKQWARAVIPCEAETQGTIVVNRQRFFDLLGVLKGEVKLNLTGTQAKFNSSAGKFSMTQSTAIVPRPKQYGDLREAEVKAKPLLKQLGLCTLSEELAGGGFGVTFGESLEIISSDRVRLIVTRQKASSPVRFKLVIPSDAIKGVTSLLKLAGDSDVKILTGTNTTAWSISNSEGDFEFGNTNIDMPFPDTKKLTDVMGYSNKAMFETLDLSEAANRAMVLADNELAWADFDFTDPEMCTITSASPQGNSEITIDLADAMIGDDSLATLRLQISHVQTFMRKAAEQGVEHMNVQWGEKLPVRFTPDEMPEIEILFLCAALHRPAAKEASSGT